jgi:hypothetical protein
MWKSLTSGFIRITHTNSDKRMRNKNMEKLGNQHEVFGDQNKKICNVWN